MIQKFILFIAFFCAYSWSFAQERAQEVGEVNVSFSKLQTYRVDSLHTYLTRTDIDALQPDDLGELLKKVPGANVKTFGGLGGFKTVSIRGLGSQHTNFVIDGFSQMNTQTGQVNLGQIQLDNVESIIIQRGGTSELSIPVSAQLYGNAIVIQTYQAKNPTLPLQQRLNSKFGSFGQMDQHFIVKSGSEKFFGGMFLKYRKADGAYPYSLENYQTNVQGTRRNNDYEDINAGLSLHYSPFKHHRFNFYFQLTQAIQGLPGAVVLYNDFASQRLHTTNNQLKLDYSGKIKKLNYRVYINRTKDSLLYIDPSFLNTAGELKSTYLTQTINGGVNFALQVFKKWNFNFGTEELYSDLFSHESLDARPIRWQNFSFIKTTFTLSKMSFIGQLGNQFIQEENQNGEAATSLNKLTPYVEFRHALTKKISYHAYYRNSFRMPNFNELYYNSIGNNDLKPEDAHQFAIGSNFTFLDKTSFYCGIQLAGYYHSVSNMILAIPTKNLFVWSIQNVGKNEILGGDAILSVSWKMSKSWSMQLTSSYAYQQSLDVSDPSSPSYRNQIAYVPEHLINADWTLNFKTIGLRFSTFTSSTRYTLNENIPTNQLDGFTTYDISVFNNFKLDANNRIRLQVTLKNITNEQYAYVRNYVMPGSNFIISFRYAFD